MGRTEMMRWKDGRRRNWRKEVVIGVVSNSSPDLTHCSIHFPQPHSRSFHMVKPSHTHTYTHARTHTHRDSHMYADGLNHSEHGHRYTHTHARMNTFPHTQTHTLIDRY